jgi:hypothetical protein
MYIRFEAADGSGLFHEASRFPHFEYRRQHGVSRKDAIEFDWVYRKLYWSTPAPPRIAYQDTLSRHPRTWFKASAQEQVTLAWRISVLLNKYGAKLRPRWSAGPGTVLYEDDVQVVVRPRCIYPRGNGRAKGPGWSGDRRTIRRWRWPTAPVSPL